MEQILFYSNVYSLLNSVEYLLRYLKIGQGKVREAEILYFLLPNIEMGFNMIKDLLCFLLLLVVKD